MRCCAARRSWNGLTRIPPSSRIAINDGFAAANISHSIVRTTGRTIRQLRSLKSQVHHQDRNGKKVIAEPRDIMPLDTIRAGMGRMVLHDLSDVLEVVGAALMHKAPEMFFPDADDFTPEELSQLYAWASKNEYFIIPSDDGVTLTQNDPGDLAWKPGDSSSSCPRVFVTNFAGHDYTKAEKYGEIVWITKGYVSFHSLDRIKYRVCEA
jgi:hypothetical protein